MKYQKKDQASILVFGNEKGGSGKSTTAMHVAIALIRMGYRVATIDLDARQGTLTRYMRNRFESVTRHHMDLPSPSHMAIEKSKAATVVAQENEEREFLEMALSELQPCFDYVVIDTPGTDSHLSRLAHSYADILVTPMNDSLIDLDLIARIDQEADELVNPSVYTEMVWEQMQKHVARSGRNPEWVVVRNRLSHLNANNKKRMELLLRKVGQLYGFKAVAGFGERVIFKELFLKGMTLLDMFENNQSDSTMSHVAARQEVRDLVRALGIEARKAARKPDSSSQAA